MPKNLPTKHAQLLIEALEKRGIKVESEHWDGHKHVDIFVPAINMYIEVDGAPHYLNPEQIIRDFQRDFFSSEEGFFTKHIPNELIDTHLDTMADAIKKVVDEKGVLKQKIEDYLKSATTKRLFVVCARHCFLLYDNKLQDRRYLIQQNTIHCVSPTLYFPKVFCLVLFNK